MPEIILPKTDDPNALSHASIIFERQLSGLYLPQWREGVGGSAFVNIRDSLGNEVTGFGAAGQNGTLGPTDVDGALTPVGSPINTADLGQIFVDITNGAAALSALDIQVSADGSDWFSMFSTPSDFLSPAGALLGASGDLTTLSAGQHGYFIMDVTAFYAVRIRGQSGSPDDVSAKWSGR